jgi:hypothetical protein
MFLKYQTNLLTPNSGKNCEGWLSVCVHIVSQKITAEGGGDRGVGGSFVCSWK